RALYASQFVREKSVVTEFRKRRHACCFNSCAGGSQFGVPVLEMLRDLLDYFRLASGLEPESRESLPDRLSPIRCFHFGVTRVAEQSADRLLWLDGPE